MSHCSNFKLVVDKGLCCSPEMVKRIGLVCPYKYLKDEPKALMQDDCPGNPNPE